jgi:hypothetical protein
MRIKKINFRHYKTFQNFSIDLSGFDVLVGLNNAGKSTIIGALRILSEGLRKAKSKMAEVVDGLDGETLGYVLDLRGIPVSTENVFYDYDQSQAAVITFYLENGYRLILYFPEKGICFLIPEGGGTISSPALFKKNFPIEIRSVPILGPVEHQEEIYQKEAARKALLTHRASRNFRNIWYHYPEGFEEFRGMIKSTWPGMDIKPPERIIGGRTTLAMFCPEERIPREIYWAGFGFQVWCQMLTFILQAKRAPASLLIIDEPDIYLHSDLQRRLVGILRELEMQVVIATHSIEIITEVEPGFLLTIDKKRQNAVRISNFQGLRGIYQLLGSNTNPILTQLAKTRRALFLEGKDFRLISLFAKKLKYNSVANRSDFAVIPVEGFNPQKVKNFAAAMEITLGVPIFKGVIFDRDYRSVEEMNYLTQELKIICQFAIIHNRKEIENFLLHPNVLDRAVRAAIKNRNKGIIIEDGICPIENILKKVADSFRANVLSQYLSCRRSFIRNNHPGINVATIDKKAIEEFDSEWESLDGKLRLIPGKEAFSKFNQIIQKEYGISLTPYAIIDAFKPEEISIELKELILNIVRLSQTAT